ncbi:ABC transporter ATP-binding protein [Alicyclobacillus sp. SO9]|uniref:ABC transporter ATP-binding protein n=1 Tax=Alicyclobacillus sp. SO9 TaxID=2665646 RepID=UPI0018E735B3|nr:ABC transporter ATP-binding protein [Alicyclobacillus sp. SO9]QQE77386.1 ABC transporter ATP-binding protein [Alicyclobacillus sp. SO9]
MIETQNLTKRFGRHLAVNSLNLSIRKGSIFGFVGENGAGKTTTLSMLATLTAPSSGKAYIEGYEITKQAAQVRREIGYMPDAFGVFDDVTVMEYLLFFAECYDVPRGTAERRAKNLLEWVSLTDKIGDYVNALSRGMQQRLEIARCLMHDPSVLILDEPNSGLDPRSRVEMRSVLQNLRSLNKTIVVSSHILHELGSVADEIGVVRGGELSAIASIHVLLSHSTAFRTLWITGVAETSQWERVLRDDPQVLNVKFVNPGVEVVYAGTIDQQAGLMNNLLGAGIKLYQFAERPTDIEELFLRLTEGSESES